MKKIFLTQGKVAIVDDEDHFWLSMWVWCCHNGGYAVRNERCSKIRKIVLMHRVILERKLGHSNFEQVDHKDGDRLNNRKANLRVATNAQNMRNRGKNVNNTSGYKGVTWFKRDKNWTASIWVNGVRIHLGYFNCKIEAAKAYDIAAKKYHREFAVLNFPKEDDK